MPDHDTPMSFGRWLRQKRESRGLRPIDLARALGYKNTSKGCRRIQTWESDGVRPDPSQVRLLQQALGLTAEQWSAELAAMRAAAGPLPADIAQQTKHLLARHGALLLSQRERLQSAEGWRGLVLTGLSFGMMYIGGEGGIYLQDLLQAWSEGRLQVETDAGPVWLYSGGGSPLSGMHTMQGFEVRTGACGSYPGAFLPTRRRATAEIRAMVQATRARSGRPSHWSLPQLLSQLGIKQPAADLHRAGVPAGRYDFARAILHWQGETVCFPLRAADAALNPAAVLRDPSLWPGAAPPTSLLQRLSAEGLSGRRTFLVQGGHRWTFESSQICAPSGHRVVSWTHELPPLVQAWLAHRLWQDERSG